MIKKHCDICDGIIDTPALVVHTKDAQDNNVKIRIVPMKVDFKDYRDDERSDIPSDICINCILQAMTPMFNMFLREKVQP